jgi:phospholipid/cholesterol/gamma-HCH transport system ATP-binding protein
MSDTSTPPLLEIRNLSNYLGNQWVHKDLNLTIQRRQIAAIIGGSGSGKTTLLRSILMLHRPTSGTIKIFNTHLFDCPPHEAMAIRRRWGVLFQHSALFSSLTVLENVLFPLRTFTHLPPQLQKEIALLKIALTGLPLDAAAKYPGELSGGMQKRAALARAIALDPELLFLDEPTSGLDPQSARELDELILNLRASLNLTVVMVIHDLATLWHATDTVAFLGDGKVIANLPMAELVKDDHPLIHEYFKNSLPNTSPT